MNKTYKRATQQLMPQSIKKGHIKIKYNPTFML